VTAIIAVGMGASWAIAVAARAIAVAARAIVS